MWGNKLRPGNYRGEALHALRAVQKSPRGHGSDPTLPEVLHAFGPKQTSWPTSPQKENERTNDVCHTVHMVTPCKVLAGPPVTPESPKLAGWGWSHYGWLPQRIPTGSVPRRLGPAAAATAWSWRSPSMPRYLCMCMATCTPEIRLDIKWSTPLTSATSLTQGKIVLLFWVNVLEPKLACV